MMREQMDCNPRSESDGGNHTAVDEEIDFLSQHAGVVSAVMRGITELIGSLWDLRYFGLHHVILLVWKLVLKLVWKLVWKLAWKLFGSWLEVGLEVGLGVGLDVCLEVVFWCAVFCVRCCYEVFFGVEFWKCWWGDADDFSEISESSE